MGLMKMTNSFILNQTKELVFDLIGYTPDFSSIPRSVSMNTEARLIRKIGGTSLSNSKFFSLVEYILKMRLKAAIIHRVSDPLGRSE